MLKSLLFPKSTHFIPYPLGAADTLSLSPDGCPKRAAITRYNKLVICYFTVFSGLCSLQSPITSWEIDGETVETVSDFIFGGSQITADGECSHEIKRHLFLGRKLSAKELMLLNCGVGEDS